MAKTRKKARTVPPSVPAGRMVISYKTMRKLIGILGIALPVILIVGRVFNPTPWPGSISAFYYTNMRDALVGILFAVSLFLFSYNGYDLVDIISTDIAALAALGVALFPCNAGLPGRVGIFHLLPKVSGGFHVFFACLFFLTLAFISAIVFTMHEPDGRIDDDKRARNILYITCAAVIVAAMIATAISMRCDPPLVFLWEAIALWAFGISWLVKGEALPKVQRVLGLRA